MFLCILLLKDKLFSGIFFMRFNAKNYKNIARKFVCMFYESSRQLVDIIFASIRG